MSQAIYYDYVSQYGYPPKEPKHLVAFAKTSGMSIKFQEAKRIMKINAKSESKEQASTDEDDDDDDHCGQEAIVNNVDGRRKVTQSEDKTENIMQCIGYLEASFKTNQDKLNVAGTGTVFEVKTDGTTLVLTCAHNVRALIYKCSKCNKEMFIKKRHNNHEISDFLPGKIVKANTIKFMRRSILNEYQRPIGNGNIEVIRYGDTEEVYVCDVNKLFIDEENYAKFPTGSGGYDLCVLQFIDNTKYYQTYTKHIELGNGK
eukprot:382333_1